MTDKESPKFSLADADENEEKKEKKEKNTGLGGYGLSSQIPRIEVRQEISKMSMNHPEEKQFEESSELPAFQGDESGLKFESSGQNNLSPKNPFKVEQPSSKNENFTSHSKPFNFNKNNKHEKSNGSLNTENKRESPTWNDDSRKKTAGKIQLGGPNSKVNQMAKQAPMSARLAQSDPYLKRRKHLIASIFICMLASSGYFLSTKPKLQSKILSYAKGVMTNDIPQMTKNTKDQPIKKHKVSYRLKKAFIDDSCSTISRAGLNDISRNSLPIKDRVRLASCLSAASDINEANKVLSPITGKFRNLSDAKINLTTTLLTTGKAYLLKTELLLKQEKFEEAKKFAINRCRIWTFNVTCLAKLHVMATIGGYSKISNIFQTLYGDASNKYPMLKAFFLNTGGIIAANENSKLASDERFSQASKSAPKKDEWLKKTIFDNWIFNIFKRKDSQKMRRIVSRVRRDLENFNGKTHWKYMLLKDLLKNSVQKSSLDNFFSRNEYIFLGKKDGRFSRAIGPYAIKTGLSKKYSQYLVDVINYHQLKYGSSKSSLQEFTIWKIRSAIALERFDKALKEIANSERTFGSSATLSHLKGICYLELNQHKKSQLLAAREFKKTLTETKSWETYFALGLALVKASELHLASKVIDKISTLKSTSHSQRWYSFLQAEFLIAKKKPKSALKILDSILRASPNSYYGWKLKAKALRELFKRNQSIAAENRADRMLQQTSYFRTKEGLNSPIGPLSLTIK